MWFYSFNFIENWSTDFSKVVLGNLILSKYTPSSFDCVIDKSTLDTFLCSEELFNHIPDYLEGILQVLKQNGYLLLISINPPEAVIIDFYLL